MTWLLWKKAERTLQVGDTTATLEIALVPFVYLMCALIFATANIHLVKAFLAGPEARGGAGAV